MTIHIAGEEDEQPALAREIVAAIDRLTKAVEEMTKVLEVGLEVAYKEGVG